MYITPETISYDKIKNDIESGLIKIPRFQRKFVWDKLQSAKLIDSILKGYPINSFIIWQTKENLRFLRNIGNIDFKPTPKGHFINYILDGQQRITSIYTALNGIKFNKTENKEEDYSKIYVDLDATSEEDIVILDVENKDPQTYISLVELMNGSMVDIVAKYSARIDKIDDYRKKITKYQFSLIRISDADIVEATEIFTRLNVGGKKLSVFEIMVAKTFDNDKDFDLSKKYDALIKKLKDVNYETIPDSTLLQCISVCLTEECTKKVILNLNKNDFIAIYDKVENALLTTIDYFRTVYRIPVSELLPYDGLIVPFTYFFYKSKKIKPTANQAKLLEDYFWRNIISSRFFSSLEQRIGQDINRIKDYIIQEKQPKYDEIIDLTMDTIIHNGEFTTSKGYIKGLLCLLAYQQPKSFKDNSIVVIDNAWLKQANSKNYHHFFPKAYMKKYQPDIPYERVNHIANITIVDGYINKQEIKDKAPSNYIDKYQKENLYLSDTLRTHLIELDSFGIKNNDYNLFFEKRILKIIEELKKRIILTSIDKYNN